MGNKDNLPVFGVGPFYVITCLILTLAGVVLDYNGIFNGGKVYKFRYVMIVIGVILIIVGIILWIKAVIIQRVTDVIKKGELLTEGVYSIVRNPIYSAFFLAYTGIILMTSNLFLLVLPIFYWIFLTVLLKRTEEKWLLDKFDREYEMYCKKVNRVIPWYKRN